mgnify:CR=1 FL=1
MFNPEFFPTPDHIITQMLAPLEISGKRFCEPNAGKGNIVKFIQELGGVVDVCESNEELAQIVSSIADNFLGYDAFDLTKTDVSHIDHILMNPPFSNADEHILHMWEIAPEGCSITAICNSETLSKKYSRKRKSLGLLIEQSGSQEDINKCFTDAERPTDVNVSLIRLFKPRTGTQTEFEGYFDLEDEEALDGTSGIMRHNDMREIVNRYVGSVQRYDDAMSMHRISNILRES